MIVPAPWTAYRAAHTSVQLAKLAASADFYPPTPDSRQALACLRNWDGLLGGPNGHPNRVWKNICNVGCL